MENRNNDVTALRLLRHAALVTAAVTLAACGAGQAIKDGITSTVIKPMTTPVNTMRLDLIRASSTDTSGAPSPAIVVRTYQLKASETFEALGDAPLLTNDLSALEADLLATHAIILRPNTSASLNEPMSDEARYVGVVAFFDDADKHVASRLVIPRKQWKKTDPVKVEIANEAVRLQGTASSNG